ncbi:MAG: ankyrin repeat domain-containing protein [Acidobacteriota bacterium]|nr:ankyrin repeat domain-containing protein [Acidobacteriota bacterium]
MSHDLNHEHDVRCLIHALRGDFSQAVALLEAQPSLLAATTGRGETALHWLVVENRSRAVQFLLERGAEVDRAASAGDTPLISAARMGYVEMCKILIGAGANVNATDQNADSVLHHAAQGDHEEVVQLLLEGGADPSVVNTIDETPDDLASPALAGRLRKFRRR